MLVGVTEPSGPGDMGGVGDRLPPCPETKVVGNGPAVGADPDLLKVRGHVNGTPDHARVDGVVVGVDPDVVVPAQPDVVAPSQMQHPWWQWQHLRPDPPAADRPGGP